MKKPQIIALCGSTRAKSSNLNLIRAIQVLAAPLFDTHIFEGITELPHFIPELENVPDAILHLRRTLKSADGILISSPEFALGVPGSLKNLIDWTVGNMDFAGKPVALITGATSGRYAHQSLLATLLIIEAKITEHSQMQISGIRTIVSDDGLITDQGTLKIVNRLINSLYGMIRNETTYTYLTPPQVY